MSCEQTARVTRGVTAGGAVSRGAAHRRATAAAARPAGATCGSLSVPMTVVAAALVACAAASRFEDTTIVPMSAVTGNLFGRAVQQDGSVLVVGAPMAFAGAGTASIFTTTDNGQTWTETVEEASDAVAGSNYGHSVAVSAGRIAIGAPKASTAMTNAGSVYFLNTFDSVSWSEVAKVTASSASAEAQFGISVALDNDIAVVGEPFADLAGTDAGAVHIYHSSSGNAWTLQMTMQGTDVNGHFGFAVASKGYVLAVGAPMAASGIGQVHIYKSPDSGQTWTSAGVQSTGASGDHFGKSLALGGNHLLVVGAPSAGLGGRAYVLQTSDGYSWTQVATLNMAGGAVGDQFGRSIDVDGDHVLVGAPGASSEVGAAVYFETMDGGLTWDSGTAFLASDGATSDKFGRSVSLEAGLAVVGAPGRVQAYAAQIVSHTPGSAGDPVLIDFFGHRFLGGKAANSEFVLYRSADGTEMIKLTTGNLLGYEGGYFAVAATVTRAACGSLTATVVDGTEHVEALDITGDSCMLSLGAHGDNGMLVLPMADSGAVVAIKAHHASNAAFVNVKLLAVTDEFKAACTGMLCEETHTDVVA